MSESIYDILTNLNDVKLNSVIIECGGHNGSDTIKLEKTFNIPVYSIEANTDLYNKYLVNINNQNIHVYNFGLSDSETLKPFYIDTDPNGDAGASSFLRAHPGKGLGHLFYIEQPIIIETKTLNTFISDNKIKDIYLLWLDVEQHEYEILNACSDETLNKIQYIYLEANFQELRINGKLRDDIVSILKNKNFKIISESSQGGENWQANILFGKV